MSLGWGVSAVNGYSNGCFLLVIVGRSDENGEMLGFGSLGDSCGRKCEGRERRCKEEVGKVYRCLVKNLGEKILVPVDRLTN